MRPQEQQQEENVVEEGRQESNVMQLTYEVHKEKRTTEMAEQGKDKTTGDKEVNNSA